MSRIIKPLGTLIFLSLLLSFISLPWGIVFSLITAFLSVFLTSHYNNFVQLEEQVNQGWADIDTALQKRSDLTARIIEILKSYVRHEHSTLEDVTRARKQFAEARTMKEKIETAEKFEGGMARLFVLVERYPELKANISFNKALETLTDLEEGIFRLRREFNQSVRQYNITAKTFPSNLAFMILGFRMKDYFNISESNRSQFEPVFDYAEQEV